MLRREPAATEGPSGAATSAPLAGGFHEHTGEREARQARALGRGARERRRGLVLRRAHTLCLRNVARSGSWWLTPLGALLRAAQ